MWLVPPLLHLSVNTCSHHYTFSLSRPGLSLWQVPPCVSPFLPVHPPYPHHSHIDYTSHFYTPPTTSHLARLVIVAGPAYPPHFQHITTLSPSSSSSYHPPLPTSPRGYIVARLVIVAGPAISSYLGLSLKPPSSLSPLPIPTYKPTPPPLQAPGPACHCGWSRLSPYLIFPSPLSTHLIFSYSNLARLIIVVGPAHPNPPHLPHHRTLWPSQILPITP